MTEVVEEFFDNARDFESFDKYIEVVMKENNEYYNYLKSVEMQQVYVPADKVLVDRDRLIELIKKARDCPNCFKRDVCGIGDKWSYKCEEKCIDIHLIELTSLDFWGEYSKKYGDPRKKEEEDDY